MAEGFLKCQLVGHFNWWRKSRSCLISCSLSTNPTNHIGCCHWGISSLHSTISGIFFFFFIINQVRGWHLLCVGPMVVNGDREIYNPVLPLRWPWERGLDSDRFLPKCRLLVLQPLAAPTLCLAAFSLLLLTARCPRACAPVSGFLFSLYAYSIGDLIPSPPMPYRFTSKAPNSPVNSD